MMAVCGESSRIGSIGRELGGVLVDGACVDLIYI